MTISVEQLVQREVLCCMSHLVSTLAACPEMPPSSFGRARFDNAMTLSTLCQQAAELAAPVLDPEESLIQNGWTKTPDGWWWREPKDEVEANEHGRIFLGSGPFIIGESTEAAIEWDGLDPYEREVFEHWAVSQRFAEQLIAEGENVDTDFANLCIWARTCTRQDIAADAVVQRIHAKMLNAA